MSSRQVLVSIVLLFAAVCSSFGQVGRATITGVVTDSTGAAVPSVSIKATNTATNVGYDTVSNEVGNYTIRALPIGPYSVTYNAAGFKVFTRQGLDLITDQIARVDVVLQVGQRAESVTVAAEAEMVQTETSQNATDVASRIYNDLPLSFSGAGRDMSSFAQLLVPGVATNESSWAMRIQGAPEGSVGIVLDGMSQLTGFLPGDFNEQIISPDAIQEMNTHTGSVNAEFGRQSGGTLEFTLKSGTNDVHGSAFYYLHNEFFNANDWNNNRLLAADPTFSNPSTKSFKRPIDRRNDWATSLGGPVYVPKLYNGRNRTFFHFTFEHAGVHTSGPSSSPSVTVPQPQMFTGDLSALLTHSQVGTDVLGRPVYQGEVYDPSTLRQVNNQYVADPFPGNVIPQSRISKVATNFAPIFAKYYPPVSTALVNNLYFTNYGQQVTDQVDIKIDHSLSPHHKLGGFFYWSQQPRNFQDQGGMWSLIDPDYGGPLARAMQQNRRGPGWNVTYDWTLTPTILNHLSFGMNGTGNFYGSRQGGQGYATAWGVTGVGNGTPANTWSAPEFNLGSSPVATFSSWGRRDYRDFFYWGYILNENLSWQRGSHTFKFGMEWNRLTAQEYSHDSSGGIFDFSAVTTGIPGQSYTAQTGNSFASFLLGLVNDANTGPPFNTGSYRNYAAIFAQDTWKVTPRLTLNYGLRWSGNTPMYEYNNNQATFDPTVTDPLSGLQGAVVYTGTGPGRTGKRSLYPSDWKDLGPTFGLAYRITDRLVMRGGYGISFTPEAMYWNQVPNGFVGGAAPVNSVVANSKGIYLPVFNIDNGYPGQLIPASFSASWADTYGATEVFPDYAKAGYVQAFNFGFQYEARKDLLIEADWRGSKGTRLHDGSAVAPNQIDPAYLSKGAVLGQIISTPAQAAAAGLPYPYPGFSGTGANTLQPFPQLTTHGLSAWGDTVGFSTYHSGNLIVTKRMSHGFTIYTAYTFSKMISNVIDVTGSASSAIPNAYNRSLYKMIAADDRTHVIKSSLTWGLPMGKGQWLLGSAPSVVNAILGGWTLSAVLTYTSGAPLAAPNSLAQPVGWNGRSVTANFTAPAGGFTSQFNPNTFDPWVPADPGNRMFNPAVFSNALPQQLGNSPLLFPTMRRPWSWSENGGILKRFRIHERLSMQLRMELLNLLNRHSFGSPDMTMSDPQFGCIWSASGKRTGQVGARIDF